MINRKKVKNIVGIDIGKKSLEIIRRTSNNKTERFKTGTNASGEAQLIKWLKTGDTVVMEAGNQAFRIAKKIKAFGYDTIVLNPGDVATIYASLRKTDKEDALKLARLAERHPREELPEVTIPSDAEEDARRISTEQAFWTQSSTRAKNRLHSLFIQSGLTDITKKHLSTHKNREEYIKLLSKRYQSEAKRLVKSLFEFDCNLAELESEMREILAQNKGYTEIAMSMPGIGPVTTIAFLSYIGDCRRFSKGKQVSYYAGLVPKVEQSGDTVHYGKIIKRGCVPIRRVIIQAAWALVKSEYGGALKEFYKRLYPRIGKKKAIVAVARKMMETFYAMITNGELYRGVPQLFIDKKIKLYGLT